MSSATRNRQFNADGMVYTSRHLHVSTPATTDLKRKAGCMERSQPLEYARYNDISDAQAAHFYEHGYYVTAGLIEDTLISKCRSYIDQCWEQWMTDARRPDDWRFHFMLDTGPDDPGDPIIQLLTHSPGLLAHLRALVGDVRGVFYTQVAVRTPMVVPIGTPTKPDAVSPLESKCSKCAVATDYHIDGQANQTGSRFPDFWSVLVGVALNDQVLPNCGNFTVYPGSHTSRPWHDYPALKQRSGKRIDAGSGLAGLDGSDQEYRCPKCSKATSVHRLPDLGPPLELHLRRGEAVIAHVLLAHKGGRNTEGGLAAFPDDIDGTTRIPRGSREMVFFRVRRHGVDYATNARSLGVLNEPWIEFEPLLSRSLVRCECTICSNAPFCKDRREGIKAADVCTGDSRSH